MKRTLRFVVTASALLIAAGAMTGGAAAAEPIKVGILGTTSGP
jgi:hypothetical protein